jgi:hypothetical protein
VCSGPFQIWIALYLKQINVSTDKILKVEEQSRLEKLINYEDRWPGLTIRKDLRKVKIYINLFAHAIYSNKIFDTACILVILANSITLCMEDPLQIGITPQQEAIENIFLALYTLEMVIKVLALGFIFNKGAYLRDPWNILDFTIVMSAYLTIVQDLQLIVSNGGTAPV